MDIDFSKRENCVVLDMYHVIKQAGNKPSRSDFANFVIEIAKIDAARIKDIQLHGLGRYVLVKLDAEEIAENIATQLTEGVYWQQFNKTIYGWRCDSIQTEVKVLYVCPDNIGEVEAIEVVREELSFYGEVKSIKWGIFDQLGPHVTDGTIIARMVFGNTKPPNWIIREETRNRNAEVWQVLFKGQGPSGCWLCGDLDHIGLFCRSRKPKNNNKNHNGNKPRGNSKNKFKGKSHAKQTGPSQHAPTHTPQPPPNLSDSTEFPDLTKGGTSGSSKTNPAKPNKTPGLSQAEIEAAAKNKRNRDGEKKKPNQEANDKSEDATSSDSSGAPPSKIHVSEIVSEDEKMDESSADGHPTNIAADKFSPDSSDDNQSQKHDAENETTINLNSAKKEALANLGMDENASYEVIQAAVSSLDPNGPSERRKLLLDLRKATENLKKRQEETSGWV